MTKHIFGIGEHWYRDAYGKIFLHAHKDKDEAIRHRGTRCIATTFEEFEEGEGLSDES